jgi:hypothetical protein
MIKIVPIHKEPSFIIITFLDNIIYQYHLEDLSAKNKEVDIGCWRIKYKIA